MVRTLIALLCPFLVATAHADTLFEGYSKITSGGVHVGYVVSRYGFDPKKKQFSSTYLLKTGSLGSDVTESLKAVADENLNPISYEFTAVVGRATKTIDAKFKGGKMTATVKEDGKTKTIQRDLPKGTFLSNFLVYVLLKSKKGIETDSKHHYQAIAEEDGELVKGEVVIGKEEKINGFRAFKTLNRFKDVKFVSFVTDRGEVLATSSPANGIGTELMPKPNDAVGTFGMSSAALKNLFGDVPLGTENLLSKSLKAQVTGTPIEGAKPDGERPLAPGPAVETGKTGGVPAGEGILLKKSGSDQ